MIENPAYRLAVALTSDDQERFVIVDREDRLHPEATAWLQYLSDTGRSPNTLKAYGRRVAWYLSWTVLTADWRSVALSHLAMWRRVVTNTPVLKTNGEYMMRGDATVALWMVPIRSLYEWADTEPGMLLTDVASRMTEIKYFPPGTPAGGEHGARRRVLVEELRAAGEPPEPNPEWIEDADARTALEVLTLRARDRFLIDLLSYTGIRAGEALSLFTADLHFGGGSPALRCKYVDPHFHIRDDNPVENGARVKGCPRLLYVEEHLVDRYVDYALERANMLGESDVSPHVFVNLYTSGEHLGKAMRYSRVKDLIDRCGKRIEYPLSGPHMLRHTFATRLVRGIDCEAQPLDVVQEILGHKSLDSTRIYTHDLEAAKKAAMASVAPRRVALSVTS